MTSPEPRPTASIVIPVHNKATITRQCLDALLAEPEDGVGREIIVVDDGSTDLTPSVLAAYGDRIRVVRNESGLGFAGACNAGVAAATGDFLVLLNNDTIPSAGWLAALVAHAQEHAKAAVVGVKLLFPNDTIQHAGVVFGLDRRPHHIYAGFPAAHPATTVSRRFQVVTAACALFRRGPWEELGGLDTAYRNGWEDVDFCLRAGEAGYEVHYCAESVLYHLESASRDLLSDAERANQELFGSRWQDKIVPDDFSYYWDDGLLSIIYGARYPIQLSASPLLAGITVGENERLADRLLYDRSRQVMILLRNNIVLNVRVQEAEARAADAERRLAEAVAHLGGNSPPPSGKAPGPGVIPPAGAMSTAGVIPSAARNLGTNAEPAQKDEIHSPAPQDDTPFQDDTGLTAAVERAPSERAEPGEAEPPALPHKIVGMIEAPGRIPDVITDGLLVVSGWTFTEVGDATIEAIVNGESRGTVSYGDHRPDAAELFPGYPAGEYGGFMGEVPVGDLPDGMHDVTIRISGSDGSRAELSTTFEVDNHAFETGRVIGRVDLPVRGSLFHPRETVPVSGWVLAPAGIQSIVAIIEGQPRGRVDHGALRPDIAKRRRQYADADHCGFYGSIPLFGVPDGSHELRLEFTANDGRQLELSTRIEVDSASSIDGGVPVINRQYRAWRERRSAVMETIAAERGELENRPVFAAIVPLAGECADAVEALAVSLTAQTDADWRLLLVDSGDASERTTAMARQLARMDARVFYRDAAKDLITSLNAAMTATDASWVTILRPGVILAPDALARIARALAAHPSSRLVYSDEDRVDPESAERWNPFFKPDWSPDLMLSMNYLGPLTVFHRDTALAVGALAADRPQAEIYDLALRVSEREGDVLHVADVLVSTIERAPATGEPWHAADWEDSERLALQDALVRRGSAGTVVPGLHPGLWRVRYALPEPPPAVTAVIPTGGKLHLLRPCLEDLLHRTDYPNLEVLLVDNSGGDNVERLVAELAPRHPNLRRIVDDRRPFNFSALINAAVPITTTPYLLMLNDDITVIEPDWLRAMVELGQRPEVGIVGAKLLYPDDTIQHAGVILGPFGGSVHVFKRFSGHDPGFFDLPDVIRNCSAVTFACALIDRAVFEELGGLDAENLPVAFNDTDFCLRAHAAGYEVLYTPHATLYHHESVTKTVIAHPHEISFLRDHWGHVIAHDPYYNPNLTRAGEDARLNMDMKVEASSAA